MSEANKTRFQWVCAACWPCRGPLRHEACSVKLAALITQDDISASRASAALALAPHAGLAIPLNLRFSPTDCSRLTWVVALNRPLGSDMFCDC